MKRIFKLIKILTLTTIFTATLTFAAQDSNTLDSTYKPNAESVSNNEKGVAIINKAPQAAEQFFKKALSLDNKNISALLNYATLKISQKKGNEVVNILETYANTYPKLADIHYLLGDIYFADKQIDKAQESYKKVLILKPDTKGLFIKLANIYLLQKKLTNARFMYEQAYKENPKDTNLLNNYANVLIADHDINTAIKIAKESINLKESAEGYKALATAYEVQKDTTAALEYYKKAKALGNKQEGLDEKINDLSNTLESF